MKTTVPPPASKEFKPGQIVRLKSNPARIFPILSMLPNSNGERRYQVFENNKPTNYYASQLEDYPVPADERTTLPLAEFHARLTSLLLTAPFSGNLYSLHSGRVRFVPYQYRPVLKLLRADRPRFWQWLKAICFGEEAVKKSEVYRQKQSSAQALGFESADHAFKWAELDKLGVSPDDVLAKFKKRDLPDKESPNPERRAGKIANEARSTPEKKREARERTVDPDYGGAQDDARTYLKHQYTNDDGAMFCQLCQAPQPVILNGEPHFEAVDCVGGINAHHEHNNLALCPNHAAMYKNGGLTPDTVQRAILECEGQKIPLNLAGNEVELYFTQQHLGDLRAVLTALDSEEI